MISSTRILLEVIKGSLEMAYMSRTKCFMIINSRALEK